MKTHIIILCFLSLLCFPGCDAEKDLNTIKGLMYLDGEPVAIGIEDGIIVSIDRIKENNKSDIPEVFIGPGLVELQINGYLGNDFSNPELTLEDIRDATRAMWKSGVTTYLPTVITSDQETLETCFSTLALALDDSEVGLSIPGFHLEGPYISPVAGFRGAHLEKYIRPPDWDEFMRTQQAAKDGILLITVAPEMEGAIPFIEKCHQSGVVVSLGHHNGTSEIIRDAVNAGASMSTHLGNGCSNMIHRHNNPLWPQLAEDRLTATLIVDGYHLNRDEVLSFFKMKGVDGTILVSDALDLAGLSPGVYIRGEREVELTENVVKFPAENVLAGAASPISTCVSNIIKFTGCSLGEAIQMASTNPARKVGLDHIGKVEVGQRADLILFTMEDGDMVIQKTIIAGEEVYSKQSI